MYKAWIRLFFGLPFFVVLKPLSWVSRTLAVRILYWLAFRGIRVDKADRIADEQLSALYVGDLQNPAASAVLDADDSVVLTASPEFMARPWLNKYLNVPVENIYGAKLEIGANGRFTGQLTDELPIGEKKVRAAPAVRGSQAESELPRVASRASALLPQTLFLSPSHSLTPTFSVYVV